jgi:hypothetical protein
VRSAQEGGLAFRVDHPYIYNARSVRYYSRSVSRPHAARETSGKISWITRTLQASGQISRTRGCSCSKHNTDACTDNRSDLFALPALSVFAIDMLAADTFRGGAGTSAAAVAAAAAAAAPLTRFNSSPLVGRHRLVQKVLHTAGAERSQLVLIVGCTCACAAMHPNGPCFISFHTTRW